MYFVYISSDIYIYIYIFIYLFIYIYIYSFFYFGSCSIFVFTYIISILHDYIHAVGYVFLVPPQKVTRHIHAPRLKRNLIHTHQKQ